MTSHLPKRKLRRLRARVLALSKLHLGQTGTNPSVGCVLLDAQGTLIAEGVTAKGGRPHAEESALLALKRQGRIDAAVKGSAIVSLEPCRQRSNGSESCSTGLIMADIARVYIHSPDLHPLGKGGADAMKMAGIDIIWLN